MFKFLAYSSLLVTVFLTGCGDVGEENRGLSLDSSNYIKVAKSAYAQQSGEETTLNLQTPLPPGVSKDTNALYLTNIVKPRDMEVSRLEVMQGVNTLTVQIDMDRKYATITLKGEQSAQKIVDMKTFTTKQ